jgi:hypothetical protein
VALSRREFVKIASLGGATAAIGAAVPGVVGAHHQPGHTQGNGRRMGQLACDFSLGTGAEKPVPLVTAGMDAAAQSRVDTLFWSEIMVEHSLFFASFLPGNELVDWRRRALEFADQWTEHLALVQATTYSASNYQSLNNQTITLLDQFIAFKQQLQTAQDTGQIFSLSWVSFDEHTKDEALWFKNRLQRLNAGVLTVPYEAAVDFWAETMKDHALFAVHLLDINELTLMNQAQNTANLFAGFVASSPAPGTMLTALDAIIAFKVQLKAGILSGAINSIIHPTLADHVRREGIKARNEIEVLTVA